MILKDLIIECHAEIGLSSVHRWFSDSTPLHALHACMCMYECMYVNMIGIRGEYGHGNVRDGRELYKAPRTPARILVGCTTLYKQMEMEDSSHSIVSLCWRECTLNKA